MTLTVPAPADVVSSCVGFSRALRAAGVAAVDTQGFVTAVSTLDPLRRDDIYWAGRATLCASHDDFGAFDRIFAEWFGGREAGDEEQVAIVPSAPHEVDDEGDGELDGDDQLFAASQREVLRHRDLETLSATEQELVSALFDALVVSIPCRRSRRSMRWHRGALDVRSTVREQLRAAGELTTLRHRRPRTRPRRVVFLIDISRSMEPYADHYIRLAHAVRSVERRSVEVFTLGTRLTRITRALDARDRERALHDAGEVIPDWSGGTRLADGLAEFERRWGRRGLARQAVVVVASDGWERGDTEPLAREAQRLSRLAHRVIWINPHSGKSGYEPVQGGIRAVLPHIDGMVAGHSLAAFSRFLEVIADV